VRQLFVRMVFLGFTSELVLFLESVLRSGTMVWSPFFVWDRRSILLEELGVETRYCFLARSLADAPGQRSENRPLFPPVFRLSAQGLYEMKAAGSPPFVRCWSFFSGETCLDSRISMSIHVAASGSHLTCGSMPRSLWCHLLHCSF